MSWNELDIPNSKGEDYYNDCASNAPIYSFGGLKRLLTSLGYHIKKAEGYKAIEIKDVTLEELRNGVMEFRNDGIYVTTDNIRRQIFLYKRNYHIKLYGKPRFHIRKCKTIESFMDKAGSIPEYRRANTDVVTVRDLDDNMRDKKVVRLPICKLCLEMVKGASPSMTTAEFVEYLRKDNSEQNVEVDIFGYTKDWEFVSRNYREQHNYTCERCGLKITDPYDQHFIHVHHKNGRKTDNRSTNLQCLCLRCHSNVDVNHKHRLTTGANRIIFEDFNSKYPE